MSVTGNNKINTKLDVTAFVQAIFLIMLTLFSLIVNLFKL